MRVLRCLCMLFLVIAIAGCDTSPHKALTVTMSLAEEEWKVLRQEIFPRFEKAHGLRIQSYQIESGQLSTKLEALINAGKSEIDVFAQDNMTLAALVTRGLVRDLSAHAREIDRRVLQNLVDACTFNDRLLFMPFRPNVQIVYYNTEAFDRHGLSPPKTWEELQDVARIFKEKEGMGRVLIKAYGGNPTATQVYEFVLQAGGNPYAFDDEGCITAFEFLQGLSPYLSPESGRAKWDTVNDILAKQEAYCAANWPFGVLILVREYGLDFIATYSGWAGPAGERHVIGGDVFGIPINAAHPKEALDFILFMQSKPVQEILVSRLGWPSIRDDAYAEVEPWQRPHFASVQAALERGVFRENVTWWPAYKKYAALAFKEIVMEGAEVRKTLERYKKELEQERNLYR
ncbi:MAG: ABC transporter substrate-binding protein [bacterium]